MDEARTRDPIPGDAYADNRTLPNEIDPATGESADDALEATRTQAEYLMPAEDASPEPVNWSSNPTQDSTQEAEWEEPFDPPTNNATGGDDEDMLAAEGSSGSGIDRVVDESYFENEDDDLNDAEEEPLRRAALPDDPHPGSRVPDVADEDILPPDDETTRGQSARR
jgi:hypothetical protein